jgi:hypothetical protein
MWTIVVLVILGLGLGGCANQYGYAGAYAADLAPPAQVVPQYEYQYRQPAHYYPDEGYRPATGYDYRQQYYAPQRQSQLRPGMPCPDRPGTLQWDPSQQRLFCCLPGQQAQRPPMQMSFNIGMPMMHRPPMMMGRWHR